MNNSNIFKVGNLKNFKSKVEIEELKTGGLEFFIYSISKPEYSLNFKTTLNKDDFLNFEIGKNINLLKFIDAHDVVVGENGKFNLNCNFDLRINHYTPHSFLLILSARTNDTYIYTENEFKI